MPKLSEVLVQMTCETGADKPIGTPHANYAPPSEGPFHCGNCKHFGRPRYCNHPDVVKDAKQGYLKLSSGKAVVDSDGCCTYYRKK